MRGRAPWGSRGSAGVRGLRAGGGVGRGGRHRPAPPPLPGPCAGLRAALDAGRVPGAGEGRRDAELPGRMNRQTDGGRWEGPVRRRCAGARASGAAGQGPAPVRLAAASASSFPQWGCAAPARTVCPSAPSRRLCWGMAGPRSPSSVSRRRRSSPVRVFEFHGVVPSPPPPISETRSFGRSVLNTVSEGMEVQNSVFGT